METEKARDILISHAKKPRFTETLEKFNREAETQNPICGDHVKMQIWLENESLKNIRIQVRGCTICTASSSLVAETAKEKSSAEILLLQSEFESALLSMNKPWPERLKNLEALSHLRQNPQRIPCAMMAWITLSKCLSS